MELVTVAPPEEVAAVVMMVVVVAVLKVVEALEIDCWTWLINRSIDGFSQGNEGLG